MITCYRRDKAENLFSLQLLGRAAWGLHALTLSKNGYSLAHNHSLSFERRPRPRFFDDALVLIPSGVDQVPNERLPFFRFDVGCVPLLLVNAPS